MNTAWRQQMTTVKLLTSFLNIFSTTHFQIPTIFQFNLYNQIKYYLAIKRGNFLQMQYGIYRYALQIHHCLFWKTNICHKLKKAKVSNVTVWSIIVKVLIKALCWYEIVQVSSFLLIAAEIVNAQGCN